MSDTFAHIESCNELNSRIAKSLDGKKDSAEALELLRHLARISRSNDKVHKVLALLMYLALNAPWFAERMQIRVWRKGSQTQIEIRELSGAKAGSRLGAFTFNVPIEEFYASLAPERRTNLHEQFVIDEKHLGRSIMSVTLELKPRVKSIRPPVLSKRASVRPLALEIKKIDDDW